MLKKVNLKACAAFHRIAPAVRAPREAGLALGVFTFLMLCFVGTSQGALRHFDLVDADDYMRLVQVMNWLSGQGWYDLGEARLSPGDGVALHWSRLVDLPLAMIALAARPFLDLHAAVKLAALIVPPVLLGLGLLPLTMMMARPFVPRRRAGLATLLLVFMASLLFNFSPGRVDHHAYQILIGGFGFACLARLVVCPNKIRPALLAALVFSAGLWIGGEALLCLSLFGFALVMLAAWRGEPLLFRAACFGGVLMAGTGLALAFAREPSAWTHLDMTWFSGAYVLFAGLMGTVCLVGWMLGRRTPRRGLRLALLATLAGFAALLFFRIVPKALNGPYADFGPLSAALVLGNVGEAMPLLPSLVFDPVDPERRLASFMIFLQVLLLPSLGLGLAAWQSVRRRGRARILWALVVLFLAPMLALTLFWQVRTITFLQLFALVPLTWQLERGWNFCARHLPGRWQFWGEILVFGMLGLLPVVVIPGAVAGKPLYPDLLLFPAARPAKACHLDFVRGVLNEAPWNERPHLIMNTLNDGPELLFTTPHRVLSAPYDAPGNRDSFDFFNARRDDSARRILERRKVDLVLLCRKIPPFYTGIDKNTRFSAAFSVDNAGNLHMRSDKDHPTLIERLIAGETPPWLKRVEVPFDKDYLLYAFPNP